MRQNMTTIAQLASDPMVRNTFGIAVTFIVTLVVSRMDDVAYVEWPRTTPLVNVLAAMNMAERSEGLVFDPLDPDLWQETEDGYRLHAMFREDLSGEEIAYGIGSR